MPAVVLFILVVGYLIFQNFWFLLWLPLVLSAAAMVWVALETAKDARADRQICPVCNNWIQSVIMIDWDRDDDPLCSKHAARRLRIWDRELSLGLSLSGSVRRSSKEKQRETLQ